MPISYKRTNSMKLEYQVSELRREDKWNCNFCPFERERSLTATYKIVSYNTSNNDYNDIAYICVECKKALDDDTLPCCNDCGRIMRNRIDCLFLWFKERWTSQNPNHNGTELCWQIGTAE